MNLINRDDIHITVHYARECGKREVTDALVKAIEEAIFKLPVIDAEPVRHGKWIDIDSQTYTWKVRCDQCGHERSMMSTQGRYPKYCENCGARMDAQEDGE